MQRKIGEKLVAWKNNPYRKPLVLLGCRQVDKTYSIHQFLSSNYESYIEVSLEKEPDMRRIFENDLMDDSTCGPVLTIRPRL